MMHPGWRVPLCLGLGLAAGCGAAAPGPAAPSTPSAVSSPVNVAPVAAAKVLPPLTDHERQLQQQLQADLKAFTQLGQRNIEDPLRFADATDWVAGQLEAIGYGVDRQGFVAGPELAQNLVVHTPGLRLGREHLVIAARLDTAAGSVGSDDNGSGVVALLILARHFYGKRTERTIDWVWLADAGGRRDAAASGAQHFIKTVRQYEVQVRLVIELYGLGAFSTQANSQRYSDTLPGNADVAEFLGLVTYPEHALLSEHFLAALEQHASLPVARFTALSDSPPVAHAVHTQFLGAGFPALLVYDTHELRYPQFGTSQDTPERLDYERMARAVAGVQQAILKMAGGYAKLPDLAGPDAAGGEQTPPAGQPPTP